jgi:hypothetical protein
MISPKVLKFMEISTLLVDLLLFHWSLKSTQNLLHSVITVDFGDWGVFKLLLCFSLEGSIELQCSLFLSHVGCHLQHPNLYLLDILVVGSQVVFVIAPCWRVRWSATAPSNSFEGALQG